MYATNRLLGFESLSPSFFGAQSPQVPVKPSPEVQTLLDAAAKLPKADQLAGYEKALDAAIASKDPAGARFAARELRNGLIALKRTNEVEPYLLGLQKRAQQAKFPLMEAHVLVNLALTYEADKQMDRAIAACEAAGKLFDFGGDSAGHSRVSSLMASTYDDLGRTKDAERCLELAVSKAAVTGDSEQFSKVLIQAANHYKSQGETVTALKLLLQSLPFKMAIIDNQHHFVVVKTANELIGELQPRNSPEETLSTYKITLQASRKIGDLFGVEDSLSHIASLYVFIGDRERALSSNLELLATRKQIGDLEGVQKCQVIIAALRHKVFADTPSIAVQAIFDEAASKPVADRQPFFIKALELAISTNDINGVRAALANLRSWFQETKNFTNGAKFFDEYINRDFKKQRLMLAYGHLNFAFVLGWFGETDSTIGALHLGLDICRESLAPQSIAEFLETLIATYHQVGKYDMAKAYTEEHLAICSLVGDARRLGTARYLAGITEWKQRDLFTAQRHLERSLAIWRQVGDKQMIGLSLDVLGEILRIRGELPRSLDCHKEALQLRTEQGDTVGIATCRYNLGIHYFQVGRWDEARLEYSASLDIAKKSGNKPLEANCLNGIADVYFLRGNPDLALSTLNEAVTIRKSLGDNRAVAESITNIARIQLQIGKLDKAEESLLECLKLQKDIRDQPGIAQTLVSIGSLLGETSSYVESIKVLKQALVMFGEIGDERATANTYDLLGGQQLRLGECSDAIVSFRRSESIAKKIGDKHQRSSSLHNIALVLTDQGEVEEAIHAYEESLQISRELNYIAGIAGTLINIAGIEVQQGKFDSAKSRLKQSLSLFTQAGDVKGISGTISSQGVLAGLEGNLDSAAKYYDEAIELRLKSGITDGLSLLYNNKAAILFSRGDYANAFSICKETKQFCASRGFKDGQVSSSLWLIDIYLAIGNLTLANVEVTEAMSLSTGLNDVSRIAHCHIGQAVIKVAKRDFKGALESYKLGKLSLTKGAIDSTWVDYLIAEVEYELGHTKEALRLLQGLSQGKAANSGKSSAFVTLGRCQLRLHNLDLASRSMLLGLSLAESRREPDDIAKVYSALADHALAMKDRDVAIIHLKRAIEARQVQRRGSIGLDDAMTASLSLKVAPDYRKLAGLLTDSGRLGEAMEVAELLKRSEAKVRGGDIARETPADQGKVSAAEAAYRKAAEDLGKLGDRERFLSKVKYPSDSVKAEITAMPAKLKVANKALTDALNLVVAEEKAAGSSAGRLRDTGAAQARLAATLKRLGPGYAAVTVLCLPDSIRFLVSTPTSLTMKRVTVAEKTVVGQVKALRDALLDPTSDPIPSAKALHTVLWAPIESELKRLGVKHVLLSLTGTARYVPFGALHNGTQYVAQGWGLSLYSPTVLEHIGDRTAKQWSVLAAGNSTERTVDDGIGSKLRFTSLPGVRAELSRVRQSVGAGPAPILDNEFTLATLKDGLAKQPSVVHLASHFQFDPRAESLSFLLTGQGEVLRASDTTVLTKDAFKGVDLLTLSACQTGTFSETADGMEVEGIASLMQRKGAGAVMSTLWPVADASTAAFMGTFYTLRSQDPRRTKAWCLREAQLRMIRGEVAPPGAPKVVATRGTTSIKVSAKGLRKDWSHPYHWAPFILQGNPF